MDKYNDQEYFATAKYPADCPYEWKEHARESARRNAAMKIMGELMKAPGYMTVRVYTEEVPANNSYSPWDNIEYRVRVELSNVSERNIERYAGPRYDEMQLAALTRSALDEIKYRVKAKVKRLFHRGG